MSDPFQPIRVVVKEEPACICSDTAEKPKPSQSVFHLENTQDHSGLKTGTTEMEDPKYWPLSGKPYFDMIFTKSQVTPPYQLYLPNKIIPELPSDLIPIVLTYCGKSWNMLYAGGSKYKRFDYAGWRAFATDNNLKIGDCCFFEITECSTAKVTFRTQILRSDSQPSLKGDGETPETPIIIQ